MSKTQKTPAALRGELKAEWERLSKAVQDAVESVEYWKSVHASDQFWKLNNVLEREIGARTHNLLTCKTTELAKLQADIAARTELLDRVRRLADDTNIDDARSALAEFEDRNALLVNDLPEDGE